MANNNQHPPFDPAYKNAAGVLNPDKTFNIDTLREGIKATRMDSTTIAAKHPQYKHIDYHAPSITNTSTASVPLAFYEPIATPNTPLKQWPNGRPVVYHIHGGGQISGDRFFGLESPMALVSPADNIVFASPEYRLAPEHRAPAAAWDVYSGLVHLIKSAKELDIDPDKIVVFGISGGAALAASACLLARKEGVHSFCALVLNIPMLDDRGEGTVSARQFWDNSTWPGWLDQKAWDAVLGDGDRSDPDGVRVAGRAESLAGLPVTFVDIGECESMRDNALAFVSKMWRDGGSVELHVWPGVYHGAAMLEPDVPLSKDMNNAQEKFLRKVLGLNTDTEPEEKKATAVL